MTTREQPYATYEEVEVVICDRCGKECDPKDAEEYHLNPTAAVDGRHGRIYTKYWNLDDEPVFPDGVTIDSDLLVELCPECDRKYVRQATRSPLVRLKHWFQELFST